MSVKVTDAQAENYHQHRHEYDRFQRPASAATGKSKISFQEVHALTQLSNGPQRRGSLRAATENSQPVTSGTRYGLTFAP
jgi:hypothetical protein